VCPLWSRIEWEFPDGLAKDPEINLLAVLCCGVDQTGRCQIVNQSWDAAGVLMDFLFHLGFENLVTGTDTAHLEIQIGMGLTGAEGREVIAQVDPLGERGMDGAF
jgi:hypothetical protein